MAKKPPSDRQPTVAVINGFKVPLRKHPTDFSALASSADMKVTAGEQSLALTALTPTMTRLSSPDVQRLDSAMEGVRARFVAHHIYEREDTGEELFITNRVLLRLHRPDPAALKTILNRYHLTEVARMGDTYVLAVSTATGINPLKAANVLAERADVASCSPDMLLVPQRHQLPPAQLPSLFREQWYLTADLLSNTDVDPRSDVRVPEAWQITTGSPDVTIAVMDDGFDLGHPAFKNKLVARPAATDPDAVAPHSDPSPDEHDFHGTPVASIATAGASGGGMIGVAPGCTLLPIKVGFGPFSQLDALRAFRYASLHADVLNCSFGLAPLPFDLFDAGFRAEMSHIARSGGRRGKGLVMVFSAGNDDAPTRLPAAENKNGVRFAASDSAGHVVVRNIVAQRDVFSAYPSLEGVIVVGAVSSRLRKSGYSNWGDQITVAAPSSNGHELSALPQFRADYRGLGQVAAINRPGHGARRRSLGDQPGTLGIREDFYTGDFGGTSGAAPVVSGVAALMLSVNGALTAADVRNILMSTADRSLSPDLDLPADPNIQGLSGCFVDGRSRFFGSGKVDALRAVRRAQALGAERLHVGAASALRSVEFGATFKAHVLGIKEFQIDGQDIPLDRLGADEWKGSGTIATSATVVPFSLTFRAPSFTAFRLTIKANGKGVYKKTDKSDRTNFTIEDTLKL